MAEHFVKLVRQTRLNCGYRARVTVYRHHGGIHYSSALAVFDHPITGGYRAIGAYFSHQKEDAFESVEDAMAAGWKRIARQSGGHRSTVVLNDWAA